MKAMVLGALFSFSFFSLAWAADETTPPPSKEVVIGISEVYVPVGQKSGSEVYVIASGVFPNGCYQWGEASVNSKSSHHHEVKVTAQVTQGMCIMVMVPFSKEIQLGRLEPGEHTVQFYSGDGTFLEKIVEVQ